MQAANTQEYKKHLQNHIDQYPHMILIPSYYETDLGPKEIQKDLGQGCEFKVIPLVEGDIYCFAYEFHMRKFKKYLTEYYNLMYRKINNITIKDKDQLVLA